MTLESSVASGPSIEHKFHPYVDNGVWMWTAVFTNPAWTLGPRCGELKPQTLCGHWSLSVDVCTHSPTLDPESGHRRHYAQPLCEFWGLASFV